MLLKDPFPTTPVRPEPPLKMFMETFGWDRDEAAILLGVDRRTLSRWVKAEESGEDKVSPASRLLLNLYFDRAESVLVKQMLWLKGVKDKAEELAPVVGEESWGLRAAEKINNVRFGPWVTVSDLPELPVGIKFIRSRMVAIDRLIERGLVSGGEQKRAKVIYQRYSAISEDYRTKFPKGGKDANE